jgi:hypothetical protein
MQLSILFILLLITAFIIFYITRPLFVPKQTNSLNGSTKESSLLIERERLLVTLEELDFDNSLGKIPASDYLIQRKILVQKGVDILRKLDATSSSSLKLPARNKYNEGIIPRDSNSVTNDDLEELITKHRNSQQKKSSGFCPKCGKPIQESDAYCPACGNTLNFSKRIK